MMNILSKMKFSYRVATLTLLVTTGIVMYLTWGDDYMTWNNKKTEAEKSSLSATLFYGNPDRAVPDNLQCSLWTKPISNASHNTHSILHKINQELHPSFDRSLLPKEGNPLPPDKVDHTYKKEPLQVILIPHSHNDPGWHKTVHGYFQDQTQPTLDNMVEKLIKYPNMTFIWAESVFLYMWYQETSPTIQDKVKILIERGQLEIVAGSWVVPDEANPHYFALIDQMIEGHQWLEMHLGVKPENTWSLDPFGYSATLPYLYQRSGYNNMVILRVHERVKSLLEQDMSLEFFWRQNWDVGHDTDIFTQLMPYRLYNVKHSCGPDEDICLNFDFRRIPGEGSESHSHPVTAENVESQASMLLEQYRKKATLFKHNVLLVPLGDDFRYDRPIEWDQQYENYNLLFNFMNAQPSWNVHAGFGTLKDYFNAVRKTSDDFKTPMEEIFPTLSGDFYPYTDQRDEYWSGYFTSRPADKVMGRELEVMLRSAEILHTLTAAAHGSSYVEFIGNSALLELSRRHLGLFQHHDAITGTARHYVTVDYDQRLVKGIDHVQSVIKSSVKHLLSNKTQYEKDVNILDVDNPITQRILEPHLKKYNVPDGGLRLAVFNPIAQEREELIMMTVANPEIAVEIDEEFVKCQVNPIWISALRISHSEFQLAVNLKMPPLGIMTLTLWPGHKAHMKRCQIATIFHYNSKLEDVPQKSYPFRFVRGTREPIAIENDLLKVKFSEKTGYMQSVEHKAIKRDVAIGLSFLTYHTIHSGAYIFKPEGPADDEELEREPLFRIIRGPLLAEVQVIQETVNHTVRLINTNAIQSYSVHIENIVDVSNLDNNELIMRLNTSIMNNDGHFYTDLNGFQIMKRKRFPNFPIEANYYPSTTFIYLEDDVTRVSLVSSQSLGAGSQSVGGLEVMLDRRLRYDDGRGLGEGVQDNKPTVSRFRLLIEDTSVITNQQRKVSESQFFSLPSIKAHTIADHLRHYPIMLSLGSGVFRNVYKPLQRSLPCDTLLVNLRSLKSPQLTPGVTEAALILHRIGYNCEISSNLEVCAENSPNGLVVLGELFNNDVKLSSVKESTLSLMHDLRKVDPSVQEALKPMHLYTYRLLLRN